MNDKREDILEKLNAGLNKHQKDVKHDKLGLTDDQRDIEDDYEFSRKTYKQLINDSTSALATLIALAEDAEHPRAFEVLSNMLKNTADITDRLMDLQQKKKNINTDDNSQGPASNGNGGLLMTTADLQKMLLKSLKDDTEK